MQGYQAVAVPGLPRFTGGAVGFIGYEWVHDIEPVVPRPPPNWSTMVSEVGILFAPAAKLRLLVRLMVRLVEPDAAAGTVITTGDHAVAAVAAGFNLAQVAVVVPPAGVPQV